MTSSDKKSVQPTVTLATEQDRAVISNLLQFMLYELSPLYGEWIGRDGRYAYEWLDSYWIDSDRYPYLLSRDDQLAGFALVMARSPITGRAPCWFMAEFFVLKAQRRCGLGQAALADIVSRHKGDWEVAANKKNRDAISFWMKSLSEIDLKDLRKESRTFDNLEWTLHSFVSGDGSFLSTPLQPLGHQRG